MKLNGEPRNELIKIWPTDVNKGKKKKTQFNGQKLAFSTKGAYKNWIYKNESSHN